MKSKNRLTRVEIRGYKSIAYDMPLTLELGMLISFGELTVLGKQHNQLFSVCSAI